MDVKGQRVLNLKLKYVGFAYGFLECYLCFYFDSGEFFLVYG